MASHNSYLLWWLSFCGPSSALIRILESQPQTETRFINAKLRCWVMLVSKQNFWSFKLQILNPIEMLAALPSPSELDGHSFGIISFNSAQDRSSEFLRAFTKFGGEKLGRTTSAHCRTKPHTGAHWKSAHFGSSLRSSLEYLRDFEVDFSVWIDHPQQLWLQIVSNVFY